MQIIIVIILLDFISKTSGFWSQGFHKSLPRERSLSLNTGVKKCQVELDNIGISEASSSKAEEWSE